MGRYFRFRTIFTYFRSIICHSQKHRCYMTISDHGIYLIKKWEQFRSLPYRDSVGVFTIGYGHTRNVTANTPEITIQQAEAWLKSDVSTAESFINKTFLNLRQCQFDSLCSLLFNVGSIADTKLYTLLLNSPDDKHIAGEWIEFRNAGGEYLRGLMRRRIDEISLYYSW